MERVLLCLKGLGSVGGGALSASALELSGSLRSHTATKNESDGVGTSRRGFRVLVGLCMR